MSTSPVFLQVGAVIGVIGAGTMGAGIAQVAAAAGYRVKLFDARDSAAVQAVEALGKSLAKRVQAGKLPQREVHELLERIEPIDLLEALSDAAVVIEAIVERLDIKRSLLAQLEAIVSDQAILASNTSSISITALGRDLRVPSRLVGMHFFNPVPAMKLVEVVSGVATDVEVALAVAQLAEAWGKSPIHARSTPGFVVNRIARPYYAETLTLLQEARTKPAVIDAALRAAGFRMGPCELMDLIGHDVNFSVTESTYVSYYYDKRFVPSIVQQELVDGGCWGRKSGRGFYDYSTDAAAQTEISSAGWSSLEPGQLQLVRDVGLMPLLADLAAAGWRIERADAQALPERLRAGVQGALLLGDTVVMVTDGRPVAQMAQQAGVQNLAVIDVSVQSGGGVLCVAFAPQCDTASRAAVGGMLASVGREVHEVDDAPGLVVARTLVMLINEAADAVRQSVCNEASADMAMKLGTNYPAGPFEWLKHLGASYVCSTLDHLDALYRGERYRTSLLLRERVWTTCVPD
jgi:3-hydroxybutyryl-CoA dehydrogenase